MFRNRVQRGVSSGGQFAAQSHAEADVSLAAPQGDQGQWSGGPDPKMMMVPALRAEAVASISDALGEIEDNSIIASHRTADSFFPASDYDEALHRLRTLQARIEGRTPPPAPDKVANAVDTFKKRLAQRKNPVPTPDATRPPTAELREATRTYVDQAYRSIADNPYVAELAEADDEFPSDDYQSAISALRSVQGRVDAAPPPVEMDRKALSSWGAAKVVNPSFASFNSYNPMSAQAAWPR